MRRLAAQRSVSPPPTSPHDSPHGLEAPHASFVMRVCYRARAFHVVPVPDSSVAVVETPCWDADGELVGYGATADGYDMVAPSGKGGERAMELAMNMANEIGGEKPVDYVNTHGTSTPVGFGYGIRTHLHSLPTRHRTRREPPCVHGVCRVASS